MIICIFIYNIVENKFIFHAKQKNMFGGWVYVFIYNYCKLLTYNYYVHGIIFHQFYERKNAGFTGGQWSILSFSYFRGHMFNNTSNKINRDKMLLSF